MTRAENALGMQSGNCPWSKAGARGDLNMKMTVFMLMSTLSILTSVALWPRGPFYLLVSSPGMTQSDVFELLSRTDGRFVADGPTQWTAFVYSDAGDFVARAHDAGVFLLLQSPILSICRKQS